jgi:SAM-dependent methyltransferase
MPEAPEKQPDFDAYARDYAALLHDPIREKFAPGSRFFFERKLQIICDFHRRLKVNTHQLRWLDVGCGRGDLLRLGRPLFASSVGCDLSAGMLEFCRDLEVRQQPSINRIPWNDAAFDFVTAVCVFHHAAGAERTALAKEMLRVVRPGGAVCVIEHNPFNPVTRWVVSRTPVDADAKLLGARQTCRLLASAGASIMRTRYFLIFPERIHRRLGRIEDSLAWIPMGGQYAVFGARSP